MFINKSVTKKLLIGAVAITLSGCQTWSSSDVKLKTESYGNQAQPTQIAKAAPAKAKSAAEVMLTEKDITDRTYKVIGDINVTVNKTTIFHSDPTREMVRQKLKEEGAKVGADAVILVRYGTVGVSFMSWGSLDGKGRAVAFK